jgi:hypothetical protein
MIRPWLSLAREPVRAGEIAKLRSDPTGAVVDVNVAVGDPAYCRPGDVPVACEESDLHVVAALSDGFDGGGEAEADGYRLSAIVWSSRSPRARCPCRTAR